MSRSWNQIEVFVAIDVIEVLQLVQQFNVLPVAIRIANIDELFTIPIQEESHMGQQAFVRYLITFGSE